MNATERRDFANRLRKGADIARRIFRATQDPRLDTSTRKELQEVNESFAIAIEDLADEIAEEGNKP